MERLARQARETIELALGSEADDPLLSAAWLVDVFAVPGNTLEVRIAIDVDAVAPEVPDPDLEPALEAEAPDPPEPITEDAVRARVMELVPWLRSEVAGAINRRKAPDLRVIFVEEHDPFAALDG